VLQGTPPLEVIVKNPKRHNATLHLTQKTTSTAEKGKTPPLPARFTQSPGDPPLRAAKGDDDIMSEGPSVNERG
jgi:hypothetical protein